MDKDKEKLSTSETKDTAEQDIVTGLFGDEKKEEVKTDTETKEVKEVEKVPFNEEEFLARVQQKAEETAKRVVGGEASILRRQQELNIWYNSADGKPFLAYKEFIDKAASDPRFSAISVEQLPAVVLKPSAYQKVLNDVKEAADRAAKDSKTGGTSRVNVAEQDSDAPDYRHMSREDFKATVAENKKKIVTR